MTAGRSHYDASDMGPARHRGGASGRAEAMTATPTRAARSKTAHAEVRAESPSPKPTAPKAGARRQAPREDGQGGVTRHHAHGQGRQIR